MDDVNRKLSAAFILDFQFERRQISFHSNLYFKVAVNGNYGWREFSHCENTRQP